MCRLLYVAIDRVMGYTYAIFGTYKKLNMIEIDKNIVNEKLFEFEEWWCLKNVATAEYLSSNKIYYGFWFLSVKR